MPNDLLIAIYESGHFLFIEEFMISKNSATLPYANDRGSFVLVRQ